MSVPGYNRSMRWVFCLAAALALTGTGLCANLKDAATLLPCPPAAGEAQCNPSRHDLKEARAAFARGVKIQSKAPDQAYQEFDHAAQLAPRNLEYVTAREVARQMGGDLGLLQRVPASSQQHGNTFELSLPSFQGQVVDD